MVNPNVDKFMSNMGELALTFDDVTLITKYADFLPSDTNLETQITRNVKLNIPFASAAMDTVTEHRMAIEMARLGGIGVIHRGMMPEAQAREVAKVKHYLNGLIADPVTFNENQTIYDVLEAKREKSYGFLGFPIVNDAGVVTGIITSHDIKFQNNKSVKIKEVMIKKLITSPVGTSLDQAFQIMLEHKVGKLPILKDGRLAGLYSYVDVRNIIERIEPLINRDENHCLRVAAAIGTNDYERVELLAQEGVDIMVIDTAHGHSKGVCDMLKYVKKEFPKIDVIAGNVATRVGARDLMRAGADAIKVGVGPGSICTTRVITGVGIPQITAVYEAVQGVENEIPVISDGGIRHSGDVAKAIVAGASAVMMGSVLAGTDEGPGEKIIHQGRQFVVYRGMGSLGAMTASKSSRERYGQQDVTQTDKLVPEGIEGLVSYAGQVEGVIQQYAGGLRSSLGYNGCRTIEALRTSGTFKQITAAGICEAHPHDIRISKEAPNYRTALNQ